VTEGHLDGTMARDIGGDRLAYRAWQTIQ